MPIHRTSGGKWQWGSHGAKYSSRKGAERQAAAAHANGYTGKAELLKHRGDDKVHSFPGKDSGGSHGPDWIKGQGSSGGVGPGSKEHRKNQESQAAAKEAMQQKRRARRNEMARKRRATKRGNMGNPFAASFDRLLAKAEDVARSIEQGSDRSLIDRLLAHPETFSFDDVNYDKGGILTSSDISNKAVNAIDPPQRVKPHIEDELDKAIDDLAPYLSAQVLKADANAKNVHAVILGRKGGKEGGPARARELSPERRSSIAEEGAEARWQNDDKKAEKESTFSEGHKAHNTNRSLKHMGAKGQ